MDESQSLNYVNLADEVEISSQSRISKEPKSEPKRVRKEVSNVWSYYTKIGKRSDGIERAVCNGCKIEYKVGPKPGGSNYGTSHLRRHLDACKMTSFANPLQMFIDYEGKAKARKFEPGVSRDLLAEAIIKHDLPYSFVEYEGIRAWAKYLNPDAMMNSRNTAVTDVERVHVREKEKLKKVMTTIPNRICLTSDVWTASTSEGYICLTAHFVNENWKLRSKILNFCCMPPPHIGVELAATVLDCLKQWGIDRKVFSLTLDNASSNDNMQGILKEHLRLQNSLICDGEFFHVRCCAHILNLIVQEGLKVTDDALKKIRESVKYVKGSDGRMQKFQECVKQVGIDVGVGLRLDVPTRWNSTYLMLDSAIKYQKAFASLQFVDRTYRYNPSDEEWMRGMKIYEFLEPFYEITNLISSTSYPTSNLYFMQIWKIECILNENLHNEDEVIKDMAQRMKGKFDKYWKDYSVVLAFGAILDPRMKLDFLKFCYSKIDTSTCQEKVELVKEKLYKLFNEYASTSSSTSSISESTCNLSRQGGGSIPKGARIFSEFKMFENQTNASAGKSELDIYLDEVKLDFELYDELEVLNFWKDNAKRFPELSIMARDVLSIPISIVASESAFSIGGRVLTKFRSSLRHSNVQMLVSTKNWLLGFELQDDDEVDDLETPIMSKEGSKSIVQYCA